MHCYISHNSKGQEDRLEARLQAHTIMVVFSHVEATNVFSHEEVSDSNPIGANE
jgi:hypothetical protein